MTRRLFAYTGFSLLATTFLATTVAAQDITIALQDDPDVLDPHRGNSYVGRLVFNSLCDKLVDTDENLAIVPRIASEWSWSEDNTVLTMKLREDAVFHDGEPINAEAVIANLDRAINLPESRRAGELSSVASYEVTDEYTVEITLKGPDATFLSQLSDRAGMLVSPASFDVEASGAAVCSGPYSFVERVQNDRITLKKFEDHWDAENYHFDTVVYQPIPDATVRLANLRAGDVDFIERPAPSDIETIKSESDLVFQMIPGLGYYGIVFNLNNGERADSPINSDPQLRRAFELSLDREVINQVVGLGIYQPAYQPFSPASFAYNPEFDGGGRDVEGARQMMKDAGYDSVSFEITYANNSLMQQMFELVQAMSAEAGFEVSLRPVEFAAYLSERTEGNFDAAQTGASGRVDPDGNFYRYLGCESAANPGKFCNAKMEEAMLAARTVTDDAQRKAYYDEAQAVLKEEIPTIYLYYTPNYYAYTTDLEGFTPHPDGVIRLAGVKLAED
ncbi:peptide/nickel transport system substrate-binding protein [Nitratireductor aquibiodomus]|uniref:Peptide/nickel transport system substrate-binding protein n=2 Tax=Nitratireductor aquibiodomus TaxID=204799 RepID=A0A1H4KFP5_9HYPH|nr:peptide/nickel transport system substrate-binding protein [Nitratireductor aquibiodomus]